ncbi:MAG TPA: ABC transporter substrate-binding protein [Candidatus Binatia bacterium]|jgi:NitT/TauT family transport system substrate-binding protein
MPFRLALCVAIVLASHSSARGMDRIRIAVSNPNMPNLTSAAAQKKGFFKDEGIDAEIIRMNPNVSITALATGDIDYSQLFAAVVGGAIAGLPMRIVAGFMTKWPLVLIARPEFKSMKDLRGKTLGVSSYGATPEIAARAIFKHFGIDAEKEIKVLALGSDLARITALKAKVVDVIITSPPADAQMEKLGYNVLARAQEFFNVPYLGLGAHTKKIKERADEARRVIRATLKANRYIYDNRDGAAQLLVEWGKVEREFAYLSYDGVRNLFNLDGSVPDDGMKQVIDQATKAAKIARDISPAEVADFTILREAQRDLGLKGKP